LARLELRFGRVSFFRNGHVAWRAHAMPDDALAVIDAIRGAAQ
jgi:hypothetical protein